MSSGRSTSAQEVQGLGWVDDTQLAAVLSGGVILTLTTDMDELIGLVRESLTRGFTATECRRYRIEGCPAE